MLASTVMEVLLMRTTWGVRGGTRGVYGGGDDRGRRDDKDSLGLWGGWNRSWESIQPVVSPTFHSDGVRRHIDRVGCAPQE